jgi:hypothetical protein
MAVQKKVFVKVYKNNGSYITTWSDASISGFTKTINGGLGQLTIQLARPFENFGEDDDVKFNNEVQVWISDRDTSSTGVKIYSGYISSYNPFIDGKNEGVSITCLGYSTKFSKDYYKSGSTVKITHNSTDPSQIIRNMIDSFRTERNNPKINYGTGTVDNTGTSVSYTFGLKKYNEVLDIVVGLSPSNWWWYVDASNTIYFKHKSDVPNHRFIFGKHFKRVDVNKNMENVKNFYLFWNGLMSTDEFYIFKKYEDTTSISNYDRSSDYKSDGRVFIDETADGWGNSFIEENSDPEVRVKVEIIDNNGSEKLGYDIESIEPGQTCSFLGFNDSTSKTFEVNMQIMSVEYTLNSAVLELEKITPNVGKELNNKDRDINNLYQSDIPESYTN